MQYIWDLATPIYSCVVTLRQLFKIKTCQTETSEQKQTNKQKLLK